MAESAGKKASKAFVWLLVGLLIIGLMGFGVNSFGGSASAVGTVGGEKISIQMYYRALVRAIRTEEAGARQALSLADIQARGIPAQVRGQLAGAAALDGEAKRIGLSVGDGTVAQQIRNESAFSGLDGNFDREGYEFMLQQNGWSVREFEDSIRKETTRTLLQGAVASGVAPPQSYLDVVLGHYGERRSYEWVAFGPEAIVDPIDARSDADVQAYYDANAAQFTLPDRKKVTYAWLNPESLLDGIEADEAALEDLYQERIAEFVQPERRLVERLVFGDASAAVAAKSAIDAGETTFADIVAERGLELADVDLGEATRDDLGDAAETIFALEAPGVVGPYPSTLGPALYRMNGILNATEVTLDEVRDELTRIYARDAARREVEALVSDYDERLAAGATVEELAEETEMELGTLEVWAGTTGGIADYAAFREEVAQVTSSDFPQIEMLEDGGIYALRLDDELAPSLQPLEDVRAEALQGAADAAVIETLTELAETARTTAQATQGLSATGAVETADLVTRTALVGALPAQVSNRAFDMEVGDMEIVEGDGTVYLLHLTAIEGPDEDDERTTILRQGLSAQLSQGLSSDMVVLFTQAMTNAAGIEFNDSALNAVHSQVFTTGAAGGI